MRKNYTVGFLLLFVASVTGGLALQHIYTYAMLIAVSVGTVSLLVSAFFATKNYHTQKSQ